MTQFSIFFHRKVSFPLSGELFKASFNLNCLAGQGKASQGETGERAFDGAPAFMHLLLLAHVNIWHTWTFGKRHMSKCTAYKYKSELNDWLVDEHFGRY